MGIWIISLSFFSYEDLCADPVRMRQRIAKFLGLPDPGRNLSINTHKHHLVAGNPMRYKGKIAKRNSDLSRRFILLLMETNYL